MKILNKITRNIKRILGLLEYGLVIEKMILVLKQI